MRSGDDLHEMLLTAEERDAIRYALEHLECCSDSSRALDAVHELRAIRSRFPLAEQGEIDE